METSLPDKCAEHGLVTGPDGRCVLCRREAEPGNLRTYLFFGILFTGMLSLVLVVWGTRTFRGHGSDEVVAEAPGLVPAESAELDLVPAAPEPTTPPPLAASPWPSATGDSPWPEAESTPGRDDAGNDAGPAPEREQRPSAEDRRKREGEIRRAMDNVQVTVYFAPWCPSCNRAMEWMRANGIRFEARNIETSDSAKRKRRSLTSSRSIPTIVVEDTVMDGFSAGAVKAAIRRAAEKRVKRL